MTFMTPPAPAPIPAVPATEFLDSIGAVSSISRRGETLQGTIDGLRHTGIRWLRAGYEDDAPLEDFLEAARATGVKFSYGMLSGHSDINRLLSDARRLAAAGALLALEGSNEPNNFGPIKYNGETGGKSESWLPVAKMHRDLFAAAKADPVLKDYPLWALCENGAQTDNAGLQFLEIPPGAGALMPDGTKYADFANCHNYICHPSWPGLHDNQAWLSSLPGKDCPVDGLYGNYGRTWRNGYQGCSDEQLQSLPRVTTETGIETSAEITEELQARLYLDLYLSQFKQGWKHTAIYLFKGRANEPEHEKFAFYKLDYTPKQAARYLRNFTAILDDRGAPIAPPGALDYAIPSQPATTHDLLLQKSNGVYFLVLWGERFASGGADDIIIKLGAKANRVKIYDPTLGAEAIKTLSEIDAINISLTDHPVILEIAN